MLKQLREFCSPCKIIGGFILFLVVFMLGLYLLFVVLPNNKMPAEQTIVPNRLPEFDTVGEFIARLNIISSTL